MKNQHIRQSKVPLLRAVFLVCFFVAAGALPLFAATKATKTAKTSTASSGQIMIRRSRMANAVSAVESRLGHAAVVVGNLWRLRGDRPINLGPSNPAGGTQVVTSGSIVISRPTAGVGGPTIVATNWATQPDVVSSNALESSVRSNATMPVPMTRTEPLIFVPRQ